MDRIEQNGWRRIYAWLGLCVVSLFIVTAHVNIIDTIQHAGEARAHAHSLFSLVDDDHADADHGDENAGKSGSDAVKDHHCHHNLCGTFVLTPVLLSEAEMPFGQPAQLSSGQADFVPDSSASTQDRPPKA